MKWLETVISLPRTVLTVMIVMVVAGVISYISLPKEADPDIDLPVFYVSIPFPGISPEDAERLITRPMESELRGLEGLKDITAIASEGHVGIILEFKDDVDHDKASQDVREKVDQAKAELPSEAEEPVVNELNFSLVPVLVVVLSGDVPERTLYQHARKLQDEIKAVRTVLSADLVGHREELLEIIIDQSKLEAYNISQADLINSVSRNNQLIAAGSLDRGRGRFNVKVPGLFQTAEDVYSLPIKVSGDSVVTLRDVTEIRRKFKDRVGYSRINGKPALSIQVVKRIGENIVVTNERVKQVVNQYTADWPDSIKVDFVLDRSTTIFEILGSLQSAIMTAIALVMIVAVAALGTRSALFVGLAIPTSFMIGFLLIGLLGMTVNMMLMFGMVLTVGILVDGAIVIVEYADRKMAEGLHRKQAYILAAQRMFWPVVSSTATTLAAFLPMLLWPGTPGQFMSYLPITVIIVLSASLITAMIFLPVVGSLLGKTAASDEALDTARKLSGSSHVDYKDIKGFSGIYIRTLQKVIRHPAKVVAAALILVVCVFQLFGKYNNGVEFFVDTEPEQAFVFVSARGNLSASEKLEFVKKVEGLVLGVEGIKSVITNVGSSGGNPALNGAGQDTPVDEIGRLTLEFIDYQKRKPGKVILEEIRKKASDLPGIMIEVRKVENGPQTGKDIRLEISSGSFETSKTIARQVRKYMETQMSSLRDIEDTTPLPGIEWVLNVDRKEAGRYGTDILTVGTMFQLVTNGILIGKYRPDDSDDEVDIRLRLPQDQRGIDQLSQLRLQTPNGMVPVTNFVSREAKPQVGNITRTNGRYTMMVKANVIETQADAGKQPENAPAGKAGNEQKSETKVYKNDRNGKIEQISDWIEEQKSNWPKGISTRFRGADEEEKESGEFMQKAMLAAMFLMFLILLIQFNSFYQTVVTLSTIVFSVVGVLIGMMLTGQKFSIIMTGTGVVALAGIVVNNSIVLIDTFNRLKKEEGLDIIDAILRSCVQRLRPIMLTTVTTILGLLPMALQINMNFIDRTLDIGSVTSIWWVQLATAIIFGLGFSTLLTLVLTPALLALPVIWGRFLEPYKQILFRVLRGILYRVGLRSA
ncbi:MAG: efflux RND transporter permease subunit [Methyloligellaceae bacterium]